MQDPYHGAGQAEGWSFSVPKGQAVPSSLRNIYKELHSDCGCSIPRHGHLEHWVDQGVLLLNTALTVQVRCPLFRPAPRLLAWPCCARYVPPTRGCVQANKANSHSRMGWETFTDAVIEHISRNREGVVFLLWGKHAQVCLASATVESARNRVRWIPVQTVCRPYLHGGVSTAWPVRSMQMRKSNIDSKRHAVLESAHPSGLSAHRGFFGCKHFSRCNASLRLGGIPEIDWQIPDSES